MFDFLKDLLDPTPPRQQPAEMRVFVNMKA